MGFPILVRWQIYTEMRLLHGSYRRSFQYKDAGSVERWSLDWNGALMPNCCLRPECGFSLHRVTVYKTQSCLSSSMKPGCTMSSSHSNQLSGASFNTLLKTSYRKISQSFSPKRLDIKTLISTWNLAGGLGAVLPTSLSNSRAVGKL